EALRERMGRLALLGGGHGLTLLGDAGALAATLTQVEDTGPTHHAALVHLHLADEGGGHGEDPFHAHVVADLAHGERAGAASAFALDHHTLELLNAFLVALLDTVVHGDRVASLELGQFVHRHVFLLQLLDAVHDLRVLGPADRGGPLPNGAAILRNYSPIARWSLSGVFRAEPFRAALPGAFQGLAGAPFVDPGLVAAEEHIGHLPAVVFGRAGVGGWGHQAVLEAVAQRRGAVAEHAGNQPHHRIAQHGGRQFAPA